ncbi:MAG: metal ABC transporter permease [Archaeoglobales archaeon]|nr:metal ABC transporter permease [Archaeoglobales archaeon]
MVEIFLALILISLLISISGNLAVFRKASFLIASVSHSALAGVALSLLLTSLGFEQDYFLLATLFAIAFALLASLTSRFSDIDTGVAISFALSMAIAVVFLSLIRGISAKIWAFLFGEILLVTEQDLIYLTFSTILVILLFGLLYNKFIFFLFDPEGAKASGINPKLLDIILFAIIATSVVAVIRSVGAILAYSIFIAPSAIAKEFAQSVKQSLIITFGITLISLMLGISVSLIFPVSASALAALIASTLYIVVFSLRRLKK